MRTMLSEVICLPNVSLIYIHTHIYITIFKSTHSHESSTFKSPTVVYHIISFLLHIISTNRV